MKKIDAVSYTANPCLHTFYKRTPKYLFIILFLVAIIFGCTFYQRVVGQVEFGNYQHNYNNPFEIRKLIYREPAKKLTDFYDVYWREDESKQIYRNISPFIKHKIEEKPAFELTDGACYRKTVFSNGRHIMSPYCMDGRLAEEDTNIKQNKNYSGQVGKASWYEITGYCLNQQPMASGKKVYKGAIACPGFLKLGTRVEIKGQEYICEDRMALKYRDGNYIDIWFENCQDALNWGRRKVEIIKL